MANTIDWGEASVNNTNGYGKGAIDNTIRWGKIYESSASGDTNIGTAVAPSFSNTKSVRFDGVDDIVNVNSISSIDATDTFSISCWLIIASGGGGGVIGKNRTDSFNAKRFTFVVDESKIEINTNSLAFRNTSLSLGNNWINVVVSIDRGRSTQSDRCRVYVNGVQQTNTTSTNFNAVVSDTSPLTIGSLTRGTSSPIILSAFEGGIDEVAIFNTALESSDVTTIYGSGVPSSLSSFSSLTNWYRMGDSDTFPTLSDNKGSNDGTMTNMTDGNIVSNVPS